MFDFKFNSDSNWSFENELRCFIIYKRLESRKFPRGMQSDLCEILVSTSSLSLGSINAKVGNYKSEFGVTNPSNSSKATKFIAQNFGGMSVLETEALLTGYLLGKHESG